MVGRFYDCGITSLTYEIQSKRSYLSINRRTLFTIKNWSVLQTIYYSQSQEIDISPQQTKM